MMKVLRLLTGIVLCLLGNNVVAETASTTQTINLNIPVVALLDIEDVSPAFVFQAPTNAGAGMTLLSATDNQFGVSISSNIAAAKLDIKLDQDLTASGLRLYMGGGTLCGGSMDLTTADQTYCSVGTEQSSNKTLQINAAADSGMASYGSYSVNVIYTLTDD